MIRTVHQSGANLYAVQVAEEDLSFLQVWSTQQLLMNQFSCLTAVH